MHRSHFSWITRDPFLIMKTVLSWVEQKISWSEVRHFDLKKLTWTLVSNLFVLFRIINFFSEIFLFYFNIIHFSWSKEMMYFLKKCCKLKYFTLDDSFLFKNLEYIFLQLFRPFKLELEHFRWLNISYELVLFIV